MTSLLLKVTIVLAIGLVLSKLASRTRASVRHIVVAAALVSSIALPLGAALVPPLAIEVPLVRTAGPAVAAPTPAPREPSGRLTRTSAPARLGGPAISLETLFGMLWAAGTFMALAILGGGVLRLNRIRRNGLPWLEGRELAGSLAASAGLRRRVDVLLHERAAAPFVCGVARPTIVLPLDARQWKHDDLQRTLVHELEHVHRADWIVQLVARAICSAYWFHPLAWSVLRRLTLEAERACDDAVVRVSERTDYADQLVSLAERMKSGSALMLAMAARTDLSARVSALLDDTQRRGRPGTPAAVAVIVLAAAMVCALGSVQAVERSGSRSAESAASGTREQDRQRGRGSSSDRALYRAAERGDVDRLGELLRSGANVDATLQGDGTPLIAAAREGRLQAVRALLDAGANPNLSVRGDGNPLIMAAREGHLEIVDLLLSRGALIDQIVDEDENALIQASAEGHLPVVKLLVSRGANVNARAWAESALERPGGEWRTPLSMARRGRHEEVAEFLRSAGARE